MNELLEYLRQHGMVCVGHNGRILAWCEYYNSTTFRTEFHLETINPTLRDVRDWLGY